MFALLVIHCTASCNRAAMWRNKYWKYHARACWSIWMLHLTYAGQN